MPIDFEHPKHKQDRQEKESRVNEYRDRFDRYMHQQEARRSKGEEMNPVRVTADLSESRQAVDMETFDGHDRVKELNRQDRLDFQKWMSEQRQQMRRDDNAGNFLADRDYKGELVINRREWPDTDRKNHPFPEREQMRDKYSEQMREEFTVFQEKREHRRFEALEGREFENVAAIDERHGTDDLAHLQTNRQESSSRKQEPARPSDRLMEWLAREAPREPSRDDPPIKRDDFSR